MYYFERMKEHFCTDVRFQNAVILIVACIIILIITIIVYKIHEYS